MSIYTEIKQVFPDIAVPDISGFYENEINAAKQVYQSNPPWQRVRHSGIKKKYRNRSLLNTAKVVCDKMATLTFSEQCDISCSEENYNKIIADTLEDNAFWSKFPEWLSRAYALGGGVLKIVLNRNAIIIDYLNADVFYPTKWANRRITEGVFRTEYIKGNQYYRHYEYHTMTAHGVNIKNVVYKSDAKSAVGSECSVKELFPEVEPVTEFKGINAPLFAYFKPAIGNNKCFDIPLGLPIFANCYDTLMSLDIIFDSLQREFILGKKRIIVPDSMIQQQVDNNGKYTQYFDTDDEVFQAFTCEDAQKLNVIDNTVQLRIQEHTEAIKSTLDILSMQIGLSSGSLSFERSDGVKTATEVVANERDTMRTVENNKNIVTEVIETLCETILAVTAAEENKKVAENTITIGWQDNVVTDDDTRIRQNIDLVSASLRSKVNALMDINGYDEETAKKELEEISKETSMGGSSVDDLFGNDSGDNGGGNG